MPSPRDIRRRIKSVKNTAQITKAMEKVAQAKMAKAQQAALNGRPYAEVMNRVLSEVVTHAGEFEHPYMVQRDGDRRALILVTTDKGLCGALNTNLLRMVSDEFVTDDTKIVSAGRKGAQHAIRSGWDLAAEFSFGDPPAFAEARAITKMAVDLFESGEVDAMLSNVADFYEDESAATVKAMTAMLEPAMIVVVGGIVGSILLAMYLPMFSVFENIK